MQEVKEQVPLAPLTTFGIGGNARYLVDVRSEGEILEALAWSKTHGAPHIILAGGSNVLISDAGYDGLVIRLRGNLWSVSGASVDAWAGTNLLELIQAMGMRGLGGWESLSGIPGTLGGAVRGNAGAFGSEIKDFITTVRALNVDTREIREFQNSDCDFSYRHSFFKDNRSWVVTRVILSLASMDPESAKNKSSDTIQERERRHLQNVKAAGSYFMNPIAPDSVRAQFETEKNVASKGGRVPAGWLIEKAGMKGAIVGGAIASHQHPNYLVNQGTATSKDVTELSHKVKSAVKEMFGIDLKEEAEIIGK